MGHPASWGSGSGSRAGLEYCKLDFDMHVLRIKPCCQALSDHHVLLEGTLLKPNMVSAGAI